MKTRNTACVQASNWVNEETVEMVEMDFRRARRGVRAAAIHKPAAHEPAGRARTRFAGHQPNAAANRRAAARGLL